MIELAYAVVQRQDWPNQLLYKHSSTYSYVRFCRPTVPKNAGPLKCVSTLTAVVRPTLNISSPLISSRYDPELFVKIGPQQFELDHRTMWQAIWRQCAKLYF